MTVKDLLGVVELSPSCRVKIIGYDENINDTVLDSCCMSLNNKSEPLKKYYEYEVEAINVKDDYLIIYIDNTKELRRR